MQPLVVDANVWIMASFFNDFERLTTLAALECAERCMDWLDQFVNHSTDQLVVDHDYRMLSQYRNNLREGSTSTRLLNQMMQTDNGQRIVYVSVAFDDNDYPIVPRGVIESGFDNDDYIFVAVVLAHGEYPPIINAADSDWQQAHAILTKYGIHVHELCVIA